MIGEEKGSVAISGGSSHKITGLIEVGYRIIKIHEVWHFPPDQ